MPCSSSFSERSGDAAQLEYWDELLSSYGAQCDPCPHPGGAGAGAPGRGDPPRADTRRSEVLRLVTSPPYDPLPQPARQFALPLDAPVDRTAVAAGKDPARLSGQPGPLRSGEIARGVTTIGPHRDELRFLGNGVDLGTYGSRGQNRTAVLALKLAEVAWMQGQNRPLAGVAAG